MRCVIRGLYKAAPVMSCGIVEGCLTTARSNLIRISALRIPAHTKVSAARPKLLPKENQRRVASQQSRCSSSTRSHRKHAVVCRSSGTQMELSTELVDDLLRRIKGSDSGVGLSSDEEAAVNDGICRLEEVGKEQETKPLKNPLIFGNFNVAFSSTQQAPKQSTQPAGGAFRSGPGRLIFSTKELCQSIIKPDLATNKAVQFTIKGSNVVRPCYATMLGYDLCLKLKVAFALFGFLPGSVGLRGKFTPQGDDQATVKVQFEPPRVSLPGGINLAVGPTSSVVLTTTYLDERVRLGRGSRGSSFVFTRGGAADHAGMEHIGLAKTSVLGYLLLMTSAGGLFTAAASLFAASTLLVKALAVLPALIGTAVLGALFQNWRYG